MFTRHTSSNFYHVVAIFCVTCLAMIFSSIAHGASDRSVKKDKVVKHWTAEKRKAAIPRDFYLNESGQSFMADGQGGMTPYGQSISSGPVQRAKPSGNNDTTGPTISNRSPADGATIGSSATFSADVVDDGSGVRSVVFVIRYPSGNTESFNGANSGDTWSVNLQGFTDGNWAWWIDAKDGAKRGGNLTRSSEFALTVSTGSEPPPEPPSEGTITNSAWTGGGAVQTAAGRIYFEMPGNAKRKGPWSGYVCSGTIVEDTASDRAVILTAAHCLYDDTNKAFARNVLFIPNQAGTTGSGTDTNCSNDPLGCWVPDFAVVDTHWTTRVFPDNIPWDYGYYVVNDIGAHQGSGAEALQTAAGFLPISFTAPYFNDGDPGPGSLDYTHALGYSYSDDPNFMYCAEDMTTEGSSNWWLANCGLSGGSSGGPWIQPMTDGSGPVMSVNSWGYTTSPGMAGPFLHSSSANCLYVMANGTDFSAIPTTDGDEGVIVTCP